MKNLGIVNWSPFCWDLNVTPPQNKETVAVKVSRSSPEYRNAAMGEIDVLLQLAVADKNQEHFVRIRNCFDYRDHVFEKLGLNLHDLLRKNSYGSLPLDLVRDIGRQLLKSIAARKLTISDHKHLPTSNAIKAIDFGSSTSGYQKHRHLITTRSYRAPEVILGNEWSYPCNMWSIGCILIELCTGRAPFRTPQDLEHLVMMEAMLGPLPRQIHTALQEALESKSSKQYISQERLIDIFMLDSVERLLRYDPAERLKARDALTHPFFVRY
ncbi:hypothetical protein ZIOFF_010679 [Zingiber officinale]|uniref:Protein kinase domain-containing protein n=1 Tax=Zingiber officinale TaxID=94328 RepID=A0A8J5HHC1_ZINOF|nr:hypothetical protein ZIOFF_010679 [Zingiber officinale]